MKIIVTSLVILSLAVYFGCSNNLVSPPLQSTEGSGQVILKISGGNTPSNVKQLLAVLTRSGLDSLVSNSNPITDTTGVINFTNVPAGVWHLIIIASDSTGTILYKGETDITVISGATINVSLTLQPVTNGGTGNISITVMWGNTSSLWLDYSNNPVLTASNNPSNPNGIGTAKIIFDNGVYMMWYMCTYNSGVGNIWLAESNDGIHWNNVSNQPVFTHGLPGSWDDYTVGPGAIMKVNGLYRMYYTGWRSQYGKWQIGLATSVDGVNWERMPDPVLSADSSNENKIGVQSVLFINGQFYMYYSSSPIDVYDKIRINLATSYDGIHWMKYSGNPILGPSLPWEGIGISYPSIIYENNKFVMIYQNTDRTKFGKAVSQDGIHWVKSDNFVFSSSQTVKNYQGINYPCLIKMGNEYRIYYTGDINTIQTSINFAESNSLQ